MGILTSDFLGALYKGKESSGPALPGDSPRAEMLGQFFLTTCKLKYRNPQTSLFLEGSAHLAAGSWVQVRPGFNLASRLGPCLDLRETGGNDRFVCTFLSSSDRR